MNELVPHKLRPWLEAIGSITEMARKISSNVTLKLYDNRWMGCTPDVFFRRIVMCIDGMPWWYATTHIPKQTYQMRHEAFTSLGDRYLGSLLFSDKGIHRSSLSYHFELGDSESYLEARDFMTREALGVWVRRQTFLISEEPLYLKEVFLPQMLESL